MKGSGHVAMLEGDLASINGLDRKNGFLKCMKAHSEPEGGRVRDEMGHSDGGERREDRTQHVLGPEGRSTSTGAARCRGSSPPRRRPGSSARSARANHIVLFSDDGTPQEHGWIRLGQEDATISQPATLYAQYAVFYAKQAVAGAKYRAGMKTDHGSKIVTLLGNLEDAIVAPVVSKQNVNDPALWGNYKRK